MSTINKSEPKQINSIYLVASFDLTNSTDYKINNPEKWMDIFDKIRELLCKKLSSTNFKLLKQIGDEWVIYADLKKESKELINKACSLIDIFEELREKSLSKSNQGLNLKGAAWIVPIVEEGVAFNSKAFGACFQRPKYEMNKIYYSNGKIEDIMGPHMDEGFKIAHNFTIKGLISTSFGLAYLLSQLDKQGISCKIKFINNGFGILKSVWVNNPYPKIYMGQSFLDRLKEFTLTEIEMNEDINNIIRMFYGKSYIKKFVINNISDCASYNNDEQKSYLDKIIGDYKNRYNELKDDYEVIKSYFNK